MSYHLSSEEVNEVCERYQAGESGTQIARDFGISAPAIYMWLRKRDVPRRSSSEAQRKCLVNENVFDQLTEESTYWIGFLMADGNISIRKDGSPELALVLANKDKDHVEKFRKFLESTHALIDVPSTRATRFSVRSKKLVDILAKYGIVPNKSLNTSAPIVLNMNPHFWRGVVDGDGHLAIDSHNRVRLSLCGSKELMTQFLTFIKKHNPNCGATVKSHKSIFRVQLACKSAVRTIQLLYTNCSIALDRKKSIATIILGES